MEMKTIFWGGTPLWRRASIIWYCMVVFPTRLVPVKTTVRLIQAFHGLVKSEPLIGFGQFWVHDSCFPPGVVGDQHFQQPFLADDSHATTSFNHIVVLIFIFVNYY